MDKVLQECPPERAAGVESPPGPAFSRSGPDTGTRFIEVQAGKCAGPGRTADLVDLKKLIALADDLAPLPPTTVRLAEMAGNPDSNLDEIADLIEFDQALTIKLLRAANSAFSGSPVPIGTVREAVARMGTKQVVDLAIAAGVKPILQIPLAAYGFDEGVLWRHSVAAAVSAEIAQNFCQAELPSEAFTAALLHDVGKLVMGRFLSPGMVGLIRHAQEADLLDPLAAEALVLGVNHAELGGRIARRWNLPPGIVQGIIHHHHPAHGRDVICDVTYLANQVAKYIEAGLVGSGFEPSFAPGVAERLGIPPQAMDDLCTLAAARFELVRSRYEAASGCQPGWRAYEIRSKGWVIFASSGQVGWDARISRLRDFLRHFMTAT